MHWIDPASLPETEGVVACFLLNADAEADGLLLEDGTEVHFPPHMAADVLAAVRAGSTVRIRGVRPRAVAMISAVALAAGSGPEIVDGGPPKDDTERKAARRLVRDGRQKLTAEGVLRRVLHGPKGEPRGVLLEDGRSGRFPPHAADAIDALLVPGGTLVLSGDAAVTPHGTVIAIQMIGSSADDMRMIEGKSEPDHPKKPKKVKLGQTADHHRRPEHDREKRPAI